MPNCVRLSRDPMDCSLRMAFLLQEIFLIQGSSLCLLHWQADSLLLSHREAHPVGWLDSKRQMITMLVLRCGKSEISIAGGNIRWYSQFGRLVVPWKLELPNKQNYHITSNSTSVKYPVKENEKLTRKDKCTLMFTAALFNNRQDMGQLKQPSTDEWIKMWYTHTHTHIRILFSHKERNLAFATTWMDLEDIMLSEINGGVA